MQSRILVATQRAISVRFRARIHLLSCPLSGLPLNRFAKKHNPASAQWSGRKRIFLRDSFQESEESISRDHGVIIIIGHFEKRANFLLFLSEKIHDNFNAFRHIPVERLVNSELTFLKSALNEMSNIVRNSCYTKSMQSLAKMMAQIENARPALSQMAGYADFETQYLALSDELLAGATEETLLPRLIALLQKFPGIAHKAGLGEVVSNPPVEETPLPPAPEPSFGNSTGGMRMTTPAPEPAPRNTISFKVEDFITLFKEVVTAIIAILLVATTVRMLWVSLQLVGDEMRINQARELIMVMTGLVGAVIGYYFGRIPADARAAQAQQQAQQATEERAEISAQAENLAESVERVIRRLPREATTLRGEGGGEPLSGELDALQESIQQLRALSRRR